MQFELRTNHNDRTARIVDALTQQVLTETTALALDHVSQRLQRTLVGTSHCLAATAVVEQRINRLLEHPLFVADNDFRCFQLKQALQTIVTIDDATIQVIQIRGRETPPVQRNQRTQVRRQHRQHFENHPVGLDARLLETLKNLQTLGQFLVLSF